MSSLEARIQQVEDRLALQDLISSYCIHIDEGKDVDAIVEAMEKMIARPEVSAQMAQTARRIAEEKYDVNKVNLMIRMTMGIEA